MLDLNNIDEPEDEITQADLENWFELSTNLAVIKEKEMELRKRIFRFYFINPKEGVNTAELDYDCKIKGTRKINRKVLEKELTAYGSEIVKAGIPVDVIRWIPELSVSKYKALSDEQKKVFDQCLEIKDGAPELEIKIPKAKK